MESSPLVCSILLVLMATTNISATLASDSHFLQNEGPFFQRTNLFLAQSPPRGAMTCDRYPRVCAAKGIPGPDCCKKQCVNVMKDTLNCGMCGNKCGYSEICCRGECVNPNVDQKNCGRCNNKCKNGSSCVYGMCSYA